MVQNGYWDPIEQGMYQKRGCTIHGSIRRQWIEYAEGYLAV